MEEVDEEVSGKLIFHSSWKKKANEFVDWDGSEEEYGSSEPMDGLAEQCTELDNDVSL